MQKRARPYHERQRLMLCAVHAANNLLQRPEFSRAHFDALCQSLSPQHTWMWNPHRNPLGLGNYDANVLAAALQSRGLCLVWFDRRKPVSCLRPDRIEGFLLNFRTVTCSVLPLVRSNHWVTLRRCGPDGLYYNLDSKLAAPELIGSGEPADLLSYLSTRADTDASLQILPVVLPGVADSGEWQLPQPPQDND